MLAPRFCGPFIVLKHIGSSIYRLALPDGVQIHLVFHVSHLKELLGSVTIYLQPKLWLRPKNYLLNHMYRKEFMMLKQKKMCNKEIREFKIKWMDKSVKDTTWERENTLRTNFPSFPLQECNVLKKGSILRVWPYNISW